MKALFLLPIIMLDAACGLGAASSYPYLSGDTFRTVAHHIFDERHTKFLPHQVQEGEIIFVKTDYIEQFFTRHHSHIKYPYVLLTHNSDFSAPGNCASYLDDPKLIVWFAQNITNYAHPKLQPLPIGLANRYICHNNVEILWYAQQHARGIKDQQKLVYMNFAVSTNLRVRQKVHDLFVHKDFCYTTEPKAFEAYLQEMGRYCFVLSPEGNGLDCHRTWEALYMGCIPIVQRCSLDPIFEHLPVLVIDRWEDITPEFLVDAYNKMCSKKHALEMLYADYWFAKIKSYCTKEGK